MGYLVCTRDERDFPGFSEIGKTEPFLNQKYSYLDLGTTGWDTINSKEIFSRCFSGLGTCYGGSNQCELIEISSKIIEIGAKLSVGREIESEKVKCLREISGRLTS